MMPHTPPSPSLQVRELLQLLAHHYQLQRQWSKTVALLAALDALDAIDSPSQLALALGYLHQDEPRMALVTLDKRAARHTRRRRPSGPGAGHAGAEPTRRRPSGHA